jgi:hypothetical protein
MYRLGLSVFCVCIGLLLELLSLCKNNAIAVRCLFCGINNAEL